MGRIPTVTRTIKSTKATVLCVNTEEKTTFTQDVTLAGTYKDNEKLMKAITAIFENDADNAPVKPVAIETAEVVENLYGMTEQEFLSYASVLPPRTKEQQEN